MLRPKRIIPLFIPLFLAGMLAFAQSDPKEAPAPGAENSAPSNDDANQGDGAAPAEQGPDGASTQNPAPFPWESYTAPDSNANKDTDAEETMPVDEFPDDQWQGQGLSSSSYAAGDRTFVISVGLLFPTLFTNGAGKPYAGNISPPLGGTGFLGFNYFVTPSIFLGGEIGGMFAFTLMENPLFIVPFGAKAGYQFVFNRFEFPFSIMVGMHSQRYLDKSYFGFFMKPEISAYFRFNPDWSFGLNSAWWWVPQWPASGHEYDRYGNFFQVTLSARYHL